MTEQELLIETLREENKNLKFKLFKSKTDLEMHLNFMRDYGFDKYGGIRYLREILGDNNEFKNKYINNKI